MICRYTARNIVPLSLELERDTRQARRVGVPGTSGEEGFRLGRKFAAAALAPLRSPARGQRSATAGGLFWAWLFHRRDNR